MVGCVAYCAYKDSGVEWVGEIPDCWDVKPLFACAETGCVKNDDGKESNVLSLSYGRIVRRDIDQNFGLLPESFNTYQLICVGDIILRLTDLQNDKRSLRVGHAPEKGIITSAYLKLTTREDHYHDRFLYFLLHSYDTTKVFYGMGGGLRQSMKYDDMRRLPMLVPSLPEQIQIASFLDHETAKIDTLIDKQQQLIKLLKEKRQAVISHAVTKGLNPAAPMKDSGVEWLGEVPEHWVVAKLRYLVDESAAGPYGASLTKSMYTTSGYRVYGQQQVIAGSFELGDYYISKEKYAEMERYTVYPNDVLISVMGTVGKVAVVPANVESGIINPRLVRYVFNKKLLPEFVKIQISSSFHQDYLLKAAQGSTMDGLNMGTLGGMSLAFPKAQEQQRILGHVKKVSDKFSRLISFSEKSLELLQERRTALISAAVTGKIDVRNWQPAPSEPNREG